MLGLAANIPGNRVRGSVLDLPFRDAQFDVVVSDWVLPNVRDRERALGEFVRVLTPGGRLLYTDCTCPAIDFYVLLPRFLASSLAAASAGASAPKRAPQQGAARCTAIGAGARWPSKCRWSSWPEGSNRNATRPACIESQEMESSDQSAKGAEGRLASFPRRKGLIVCLGVLTCLSALAAALLLGTASGVPSAARPRFWAGGAPGRLEVMTASVLAFGRGEEGPSTMDVCGSSPRSRSLVPVPNSLLVVHGRGLYCAW